MTPQIEEIITEDGILCSIITSLPLKEAIRTCVLSPRWRYIWTHRTKLDFDYIEQGLPFFGMFAEIETTKFIGSIDSVLRQFQGAIVDEFAVTFYLDKRDSQHLDTWVRYAVASKVRSLRLHLFNPFAYSEVELYDFPFQLLGASPSILALSLTFCSLRLPSNFNGLTNLKELHLDNVDIAEADFYCLLSTCSSTLVKLCVSGGQRWVSITVPYPLTQLETLYVKNYDQLRGIEVNAINLTKLNYHGVPVDFRLRESSKVKDANISFEVRRPGQNLDYYLNKISRDLPHLRSLNFKNSGCLKLANLPKGSSIFHHLTRLDWEWDVSFEMSLLHLTTVLDAAPFLKELILRLQLSKRVEDQRAQVPTMLKKMLPTRPHTHLKTIEIGDFYFNTWQIQIVAYLLKNATELELMTIKKGSKPSGFVSKIKCATGMNIFSELANSKLLIV